MMTDTIFAEATAPSKAGLSVIRISGASAVRGISTLINSVPSPGQARLRRIKTSGGRILDEALVLCFAEGRSFTDEEVVELHLHGSRAVVSAVMTELAALPGFRPAVAGEFTRRALDNGRLDLTQVEGLADLIEAETEVQRVQALSVMQGGLSEVIDVWRADLIRAAALLEATIDFVDEDVPVDVSGEVLVLLNKTKHSISKQIDGSQVSERIREGFRVAIIGRPNTGKSTLLNFLSGRDAAITSETAGTTRDIIEVRMDLHGLPVTILDTAGLRDTDDAVEGIGVDRARNSAEAADLRLFLLDPKETPEQLGVSFMPGDVLVGAKADLHKSEFTHSVSGTTGFGVPELVNDIVATLSDRTSGASITIRQRQVTSMVDTIKFLTDAIEYIEGGTDHADIASELLRASTNSLNILIGRVDVENVLDVVFSSFCIGK